MLRLEEVFVRMNRPKKSARPRRAAHAIRRLKKTAARVSSPHFVWATSSLAIVIAMVFLGGAAAMLTAREDAPEAPVIYKTTPPPRTVKKEVPRPVAAAQTSVAEIPNTVTISGCLENDEGAFILADASGSSAPASRSWKSGFLKKRPASIEVIDGGGTLNLRQHVGRRIAATGTLIEREMRALSVRRIGSCE